MAKIPATRALEKVKPPVIDVAPINEQLIPTDRQVRDSLKHLGMSSLSLQTIKAAKTLGLHINHTGILSTQQGGIVVSQAWIDEMVRIVVKKAKASRNAKQIAALGKVVALLVGKLTDSQKLMLETAGVRFSRGGSNEPNGAPKNKGIGPGMVVQVNVASGSKVEVMEKTVAPEAPSS